MDILDFLSKYRKPVFSPEGEGGAPAPTGDPAPAGDPAPTALGGEAPAEAAPDAAPVEAPDAGEAKPGAEAPADAGADAGEPAEFKMTAPEGMENFQGEFDTYSSQATEWMQANPEATAADALKWAAGRQAEMVGKQTQEMSEAFTKQIETWEGEAKADKDIGGDAFDANLSVAKKAIDAFGDDGLKSVLNESGLGSHPAVIKFAVNAGKALSDAPVLKTNGGTARKSLAQSLYGNKG